TRNALKRAPGWRARETSRSTYARKALVRAVPYDCHCDVRNHYGGTDRERLFARTSSDARRQERACGGSLGCRARDGQARRRFRNTAPRIDDPTADTPPPLSGAPKGAVFNFGRLSARITSRDGGSG